MVDPVKPEFRPIQKQGNEDAVRILEELLEEARDGKIVAFAMAVDYGGEVRSIQTVTDNDLQLLVAIDRLHHKMHLWLDEE